MTRIDYLEYPAMSDDSWKYEGCVITSSSAGVYISAGGLFSPIAYCLPESLTPLEAVEQVETSAYICVLMAVTISQQCAPSYHVARSYMLSHIID